MNTLYPQPTNRKCPECNSQILLIGKTVIVEDGQLNPVTTSYYECSNKECSDEFKLREVLRKKKELDRIKRRPMPRSQGKESQ